MALEPPFIGRAFEQRTLKKLMSQDEASLLIVTGRRRIGKTELIEHCFQQRNLFKFEGIEGQDRAYQIQSTLKTLAAYTQNSVVAQLSFQSWREVFDLIASSLQQTPLTLYFEEVQWLANYETDFFAELKYIWDNLLRHRTGLIVILCGSSPSFLLDQLVSSKALYNRSQHTIHLSEFSLNEIHEYFQGSKSKEDALEAAMTIGGIPEYLRYLSKESSIFLGLCKNSFTKRSFFSQEWDRIFVSNMSKNKDYQKILNFLAEKRYATRDAILHHLKIKSGGRITSLITELEKCGFIETYSPLHLPSSSRLIRYCISDCYLQFYYKFIKPFEKEIERGDFNDQPERGLRIESYEKWCGFGFERYCRKNSRHIARLLGFEAVQYESGAYFNQSTEVEIPGFQIDLMYQRRDRVLTVCEIKYSKLPIGSSVLPEFQKKLDLLRASYPRASRYNFERVLIAPGGVNSTIEGKGFFDRILTLKDFFK